VNKQAINQETLRVLNKTEEPISQDCLHILQLIAWGLETGKSKFRVKQETQTQMEECVTVQLQEVRPQEVMKMILAVENQDLILKEIRALKEPQKVADYLMEILTSALIEQGIIQ